MKTKKTVIKTIFKLSFIVVLLLWPTVVLINSDIWFLLQKKSDVIYNLGEENVKLYNKQIISFFKDETKNLNFLTQDEILHMKDVQSLIVKNNLIFWSSLILFLSSLFYLRKSIKVIVRKISIATLLFLILILITSLINFQWFFLKFHEIFFVSNYAFPNTSMLKILYPDSFFRDIFILYFLLSIVGCLIALAVSYRLKFKK